MRRVVILVTEVVLPIAVAIILAVVFRTVYVSEDGCNFLWLWIVVGFPFGITKMGHFLVPVRHDLASTWKESGLAIDQTVNHMALQRPIATQESRRIF